MCSVHITRNGATVWTREVMFHSDRVYVDDVKALVVLMVIPALHVSICPQLSARLQTGSRLIEPCYQSITSAMVTIHTKRHAMFMLHFRVMFNTHVSHASTSYA
jgi:hypothetical protein